MNKTLLFVHTVDTEGPIIESIFDTFERLEDLFNIQLEPSKDNLRKLQNQEINLAGIEDAVADCVSEKRLGFIENLEQLDRMLDILFSETFRYNFQDSFGQPYRFSFFCLDHVGFHTNPRRRLLGYNTIVKHYVERLKAALRV